MTTSMMLQELISFVICDFSLLFGWSSTWWTSKNRKRFGKKRDIILRNNFLQKKELNRKKTILSTDPWPFAMNSGLKNNFLGSKDTIESIMSKKHYAKKVDSQCTTRLLLSLRGSSRAGCNTRQSSLRPFMLRRGCSKYWDETTPSPELLFCDWPGTSVSQERRGGGRPTARQVAATRNAWPSSRMTGSRVEMGIPEDQERNVLTYALFTT